MVYVGKCGIRPGGVRSSLPALCYFLVAAFAVCASGRTAEAQNGDHIESIQDLNGRRLGILTGTNHDQAADEALDYTQFEYYDDMESMFDALREGEIDAILCDTPVADFFVHTNPSLRRLRGVLQIDHYALALRYEDDDLFGLFNGALRRLIADGTVDRLNEKWVLGPEEGKVMPELPAAENGRLLRYGLSADYPPFAYRDADNRIVGLDVELVALIAERLGYRLEVHDTDFGSLVSALYNGRFDVIGSSLSVNEERRKVVRFTDIYFTSGVTAMMLRD